MKKLCFLFFVVVFFSFCENPPTGRPAIITPHADVVMVEGPTFVDGDRTFSYEGVVKNNGEAAAFEVKIHIDVRNSHNEVVSSEDGNIIRYLAPDATAPWTLLFPDYDHSIRDAMDPGKLTYKINWLE